MRVITVGRASDNDVVIKDPKVSRYHAQIVQRNDGSIYLLDLESTNGTFVNGKRVHGKCQLHNSDIIRIYHQTIDWQKYFKSKKTKTTTLVIVLVVIVILGIMGGLVYFSNLALQNRDDHSNNSNYSYSVPEVRKSLPSLQQIKEDLVGRKLTEPQPGYHRQDWYWLIEAGEIKNISIKDQYNNVNSYVYSLDLSLHAIDGTGVTHRFLCDFVYTKQGDNWIPSVLKSKELEIVRTYLYDDCIRSEKKGWSGEYEIEFTNSCDIDLVVGGIYQLEFGNEGWQKFSCIVPANSKISIGGLFIGSIDRYKIHFVERGD